jgi:predicted CoA-binding protein
MIQDPEKLRAILDQTERIAVIGMKRGGAAYSVPKYMERHGYEIVPVNPSYDEIDGQPVFDSVSDLVEPIDMVNVFRRSDAVESHVDEILAMEPLPKTVWLQLGIRNERAALRLREAGIEVVQDRCLKIDHASLL